MGLTFSDKVKSLNGREVDHAAVSWRRAEGRGQFLRADEIPMSICPFCSSDSDWPDNIVVVYLDRAQTFVQANARST